MAIRKPIDYQDKSQEPFDNPPIGEPPVEGLAPEEEVDPNRFEKKLHGTYRYVGDKIGVDFYGIWCERNQWIEVYDPFIAKKARGNGDFETKGKDAENTLKAERRKQNELDRETYIRAQDTKRRRAERNADTVLGRE